jgi:hypothetical protein
VPSREEFLGPRHLGQYVELLDRVLAGRESAPPDGGGNRS